MSHYGIPAEEASSTKELENLIEPSTRGLNQDTRSQRVVMEAKRLLPPELVDHINDFRPRCRRCKDFKNAFAPGDTLCVKCVKCCVCEKQNIELRRLTNHGSISWFCKGDPCKDIYQWNISYWRPRGSELSTGDLRSRLV